MNIRADSAFVGAVIVVCLMPGILANLLNMFDIKYWRCVYKSSNQCPDDDIKFFLYTPENGRRRKQIDVRNPNSLKYAGWNPEYHNVIIIHGFNGTESKTPMSILRNSYLNHGEFNVFTVDWEALTFFPCYLSSLANTRIVAQCSAQLYSFIMGLGGSAYRTHCVGHSLGAHICGMMSKHLDKRQYRIIGLDPARPLVDQYASDAFKLTRDDAYHVQIIHTNAGFLGEIDQIGHVDFCVNGGRQQPGCKGHSLRRARCSHFQSACYLAAAVRNFNSLKGYPCTAKCPWRGRVKRLPGEAVPMGIDTPRNASGTYCVQINHNKDCPFD